jgi:hypothetical protein
LLWLIQQPIQHGENQRKARAQAQQQHPTIELVAEP